MNLNQLTSLEWGLVGRLAGACLLAGVLGLQREATRHPAGLRTHMLVGLSAAGFVLVGARLGLPGTTDPTRIVQGIITGVGFIGAGAIVKAGASIHGITTAASLWVAAALGIMVATDHYLIALFTAVIGAAVLAIPTHPSHQEGATHE